MSRPRPSPSCATSRPRSQTAMEIRGARYLHVLVPCPLGWGSASERHDPDRAAREGDRASSRCSRRATARSPASRRSAARCRSRSTCARSSASRTCSSPSRGPTSSPASRRAPTATSAASAARCERRRGATDLMDKPFAITLGRRLEPRQQDRLLAHGAPGLRPPPAALQPRLPGGREHPAVALPRRVGRLRGGVARARQRQPAAGRHGPRLLPPLRDRLQPRPARRGRGHPRRRALPRRRGDPAGLEARQSTHSRRGKRVLVVGAGPVGPVRRLSPGAAAATPSRSARPGRWPAA